MNCAGIDFMDIEEVGKRSSGVVVVLGTGFCMSMAREAELRRGGGEGTRFVDNPVTGACDFETVPLRCSEFPGGFAPDVFPKPESWELLEASGGLFSLMPVESCLTRFVGGCGEPFLSSNSIWNTDVIPLVVRIGFGDLMASSSLGLITIGSGLLPGV